MTLALGSRSQLLYKQEVTFGTTPGGNFTLLRMTGESLELAKKTLESAEIRSDRQIPFVRHGLRSVGGDVDFELSYHTYDSFLGSVIGSDTWTPAFTGTHADVTFAASGHTITSAALFTFTGGALAIGDRISISGTASNNGTFTITNVATHVLTVSEALVNESAGPSVTITSRVETIKSGILIDSYSMEVGHLDINQYGFFTGCTVDKLALTMKPGAMITGKFSFLGQDTTYSGSSGGGTPVAAPTDQPLDTFTGTISEGGSPIALVTGVTLNIDNQGKPAEIIGSKTTPQIFFGRNKITGQVDAYFQDAALINKFINETSTTLAVVTSGIPTYQFYTFTIPNMKYLGAKNPVNTEDGLIITLPFEAVLDPTTSANITITRSDSVGP